MPDDRTALEHLLDGRDALLLEVQRLNTAIEELDTVIGRLGGGQRRADPRSATQSNGTWSSTSDRTAGLATARVGVTEPISPVGDAGSRNRRGAVRTTPTAGGTPDADPPKSIRVHVLDMLAAESREFGLAELIDGVHEAGIQAHDDAVRSITIKLMKDGKVERVGRGQYRLARPGSRPNGFCGDDAGLPTDTAAPGDDNLADDNLADDNAADDNAADDNASDAAPEAVETPGDTAVAVPEPPAEQHGPPAPQAGYTPPLNLGQPWNR